MVMIGDTEIDVRTAKVAGVDVYAVTMAIEAWKN